ncbi:MAG: Rho termination factor N-terminal domain-containing protein [Acidobacteria bacterium]|nr:Rho termination factor N-terminal domain-containing protein [Acidobacteriota bacterium]
MERTDLEEMTAPKLRELALEKYPEIKGVSGMKKEELVEAIIREEVRLGLRSKEDVKRPPVQASEWKQRIKALKAERAKALDTKDLKLLRESRVKIKRIKRRLRKLREAS